MTKFVTVSALEEIERLHVELDRYNRALCSLTPGGSEFHREPERCASWARESIDTKWAIIKRKQAELIAERAHADALANDLLGIAEYWNGNNASAVDAAEHGAETAFEANGRHRERRAGQSTVEAPHE